MIRSVKRWMADKLTNLGSVYRRTRAMPYRNALSFAASYISGSTLPVAVSVYGVPLQIRPGTPDLKVAAESLGAEFETPLSYFGSDFDGVIVDGGAYIGSAACKFARTFPKATIICIEPSPANIEILRQNTRQFDNIHLVNAALSSETGTRSIKDRGTGEWGFTIVEKPADCADLNVVDQVSTISLEELRRRFAFDDIGLLKLDVEGAEFELLQNGERWLPQVEVLVIELHERIVPGVESLFRSVTRSSNRINLTLPGEKVISVRR